MADFIQITDSVVKKYKDMGDGTFAEVVVVAGSSGGGSGGTTEAYVDAAIANLVDTAPATLNTLNELAAALGDDANFAATVTTALGNKANTSSLAAVALSGSYTDLTSKPTLFSGNYTDLTNKPTIFSGSYTDLTNKPTVFSGSYTDLSDKPTLQSFLGGGSTPDITGTITVAANNGASMYGFAPGVPQMFIQGHGSATITPTGVIRAINYYPDYQETVINFVTGTYTGANGELVFSNPETVNGISTFTVKIGNVTQTMSASVGEDNRTILLGNDPFGLMTKVGQTLDIEVYLGVVSTGSGISYNDLDDKPTLFSGSYTDLTNKPSITPTTVSWSSADSGNVSFYADSNISQISVSQISQYSSGTSRTLYDAVVGGVLVAGVTGIIVENGINQVEFVLTSGFTFDANAGGGGGGWVANATATSGTPTASMASTASFTYGGISYNSLANKPTLFSGDYNDLINKPTLESLMAGDPILSGTCTLAYNPMGSRWTTAVGSASFTPANMVNALEYNEMSNVTQLYLNTGTYGSNVIDSTGINGSNTVSLTVDGVTQTSSPFNDMGNIALFTWAGNPFAIANTNSHTVSIAGSGGSTSSGSGVTAPTSLPDSGYVTIDFSGSPLRTQELVNSTNITYAGNNYSPGSSVTIRITGNGSDIGIGFMTMWTFVGERPTQLPANKKAILTVTSFGSSEADCIAAWAVQQ